jgi:hypothetical protein
MTKNQYLTIRSNPSLLLLYEYYTEKFNKEKYSLFLEFTEFVNFIQMWRGINNVIIDNIIKYYDCKFGINILYDKEGKIIKLL